MDNERFCRSKSDIRLAESGIRATHELYPRCRSGDIRLMASDIRASARVKDYYLFHVWDSTLRLRLALNDVDDGMCTF